MVNPSTGLTIWLQTGSNWAEGMASGSSQSTLGQTGTTEVDVLPGEYYLVAAYGTSQKPTNSYPMLTYVGATSYSMTNITNGSAYARKTNNKITISADMTISVSFYMDD